MEIRSAVAGAFATVAVAGLVFTAVAVSNAAEPAPAADVPSVAVVGHYSTVESQDPIVYVPAPVAVEPVVVPEPVVVAEPVVVPEVVVIPKQEVQMPKSTYVPAADPSTVVNPPVTYSGPPIPPGPGRDSNVPESTEAWVSSP